MPAWRWQLYDPVTATTYILAINPHEGGTPGHQKHVMYQSTCAPGGKTLVFEGRDEVQKIDFAGTILEQTLHDAFVTWFKKRNQVQLTDDLGRVFWIYITDFQPKRVYRSSLPWHHTYTCSATIVDYP